MRIKNILIEVVNIMYVKIEYQIVFQMIYIILTILQKVI